MFFSIFLNMKSTKAILVCLFAALTSAGCFIQIPLPIGIPIVIQDMMALLSGLLLGPLYGSLAVFIFLVLGIIGIPVFTGKAGIAVILHGVTGGFLIGYLLGAFVCGLLMKMYYKQDTKISKILVCSISTIVGTFVVFLFGVLGFMRVTNFSLTKSLVSVVIPFLPGNLIKIVLSVLITYKFVPVIKNYMNK